MYRGIFMQATIKGCYFVSKPTHARSIMVLSSTYSSYRGIIPYMLSLMWYYPLQTTSIYIHFNIRVDLMRIFPLCDWQYTCI